MKTRQNNSTVVSRREIEDKVTLSVGEKSRVSTGFVIYTGFVHCTVEEKIVFVGWGKILRAKQSVLAVVSPRKFCLLPRGDLVAIQQTQLCLRLGFPEGIGVVVFLGESKRNPRKRGYTRPNPNIVWHLGGD